ncbi:hypothetical protein N4R57_21715 [Rhodobacteraceae bacterium D3-12]|nr:hypothetical protein N4R57_21715 [Rhodobacteraceae bacterium D3-12]
MIKRLLKTLALIGLLTASLAAPLRADPPVIEEVKAHRVGMGWRIDVTLSHPDTGWDHYADGWEVLDSKGKKLAFRKLLHPHVDEQPFTRSLINVMLPDGIQEIQIRARCSVDGWASEPVKVKLRN